MQANFEEDSEPIILGQGGFGRVEARMWKFNTPYWSAENPHVAVKLPKKVFPCAFHPYLACCLMLTKTFDDMMQMLLFQWMAAEADEGMCYHARVVVQVLIVRACMGPAGSIGLPFILLTLPSIIYLTSSV